MWVLGFQVAAPLSILGYQAYRWVRTGVWPPLDLLGALGAQPGDLGVYNASDWRGAARLAQWFLEAPLALSVFLLAWAAFWVVSWFGRLFQPDE